MPKPPADDGSLRKEDPGSPAVDGGAITEQPQDTDRGDHARPETPVPESQPAEMTGLTATGVGAAATPAESEDGALVRGAVINGRYRVERRLGRGGMGAVYHVDDQLYPGRPTALKMFLHKVTHPVELFRAEFKTMASLRHPNVARVYDFATFAQEQAFFFTMELIQGASLSASLRREHAARPVPWRDVVDLLVPVIRALAYLHKRGVVHFDLKPSNIMVGVRRHEREVRVLDFGLADLRRSGKRWMGTPLYLSPEVAQNAGGDHRSDLYSLGVMAYQMLSGEAPYDTTAGFTRLLRQKLMEPLAFPERVGDSVPGWLQELVKRLCTADPGARPASAGDVLDEINGCGGLSYELETEETRESYLSSSRFVGRGGELADIRRFIASRLDGQAGGALLVAGTSGMGKSRLMREVRQAVQLEGVTFAEADCFERDLSEAGPMASIVLQAASIAKSAGAQDLLSQYGPEMMKLVPALAQEADLVPTPPLEKADAERRRMLEATARFFVGLGRRAPFVMYVNDLQWARDGTVDLLSAILHEPEAAGAAFALLGSYRTDQAAGRPLGKLIDAGQATLSVTTVELLPLQEHEVAELLRSMLGLSELPAGLGPGVMASSGGLPFFVEEVLRDLLEQGQLRLVQGAWSVDRGDGEELRFDAAASFLRRSARVESTERRLLDLLAVCGRPTTPATLAVVSGLDPAVVRDALHALIDRQMVIAIAGETELYNLAHDRMRETLYGSLEPQARTRLHLSLARSFAAELPDDDRGERLFECVSHFEPVESLLEREAERVAVARLHLRSALATNATGAFAAGVAHLERASSLLPKTRPFDSDYALALGIEHALAASLVPLGRIDEALLAADRIVANARSVLDEAPGWETRILAYTARNEYPRAIAAGVDICGRLGMRLPRRPSRPAIAWDLLKVIWRLRGRTDHELASLPQMDDPEAMRLTRIMTAMTGCAYVTEPNLWPILIARCLTLMLRHGRGPTHALLFAWFGTALAAVAAHGRARRFARLALRLADAPDGAEFVPKLHHAMGQFLSHWGQPLSRSVDWCRSGVERSERVEDVEFAGYCHMGWAKASLDAGEPLLDVRDTCRAALETIRASGQKGTELMHLPSLQAVENLMGVTPDGWEMNGPHYHDAERARAGLSNAQDGFRLLEKFRLACLFRKRLGMAQSDELVRIMNIGLPATFYFSIAHYFACLAWLQECHEGAGPLRRLRCLLRVAGVQRTLRRWALRCPDNFDHRYLIVEAERLRALRRDAGPAYEAAIAAARGSGYVQNRALAHELAAEFHLERGEEARARRHLRAASEGYRDWGATAKVDDIVRRYPALMS